MVKTSVKYILYPFRNNNLFYYIVILNIPFLSAPHKLYPVTYRLKHLLYGKILLKELQLSLTVVYLYNCCRFFVYPSVSYVYPNHQCSLEQLCSNISITNTTHNIPIGSLYFFIFFIILKFSRKKYSFNYQQTDNY